MIGGLTIGPLASYHVESLINWELFSVDNVHGNFKAQTCGYSYHAHAIGNRRLTMKSLQAFVQCGLQSLYC
jgi:hypothetical protein